MEQHILKKFRTFYNFVKTVQKQQTQNNNLKHSEELYAKQISQKNYRVKKNVDQIYDNKLFLKYWIRKKRPGLRN